MIQTKLFLEKQKGELFEERIEKDETIIVSKPKEFKNIYQVPQGMIIEKIIIKKIIKRRLIKVSD